MDLKHVLEESQLLNHIEHMDFPLKAGQKEAQRMLEGPWIAATHVLKDRQEDVLSLRAAPSEMLDSIYTTLRSCKEAEDTVNAHKTTATGAVAEEQIFFTGEHTKSLNLVPWVVAFCVFLKVWIAPALALLTPLVLCIMPYIIMTGVMDMRIEWDMYVTMMKHMVFGLAAGEPWKLKHYAQAAWTAVSVGQSMATPFMTSYHTSRLDTEIVKRGEALSRLATTAAEALKTVQKLGALREATWIVPEIPTEPHEAVAWIEQEPLGWLQVQRVLGRVSVLVTIARDRRWNVVEWLATPAPLTLTNLYDLAIHPEKAVKSDLSLRQHSLLTGPNRGGKSSNLRATLQQVLLGQTFGFTLGAEGQWKPFHNIFTRLKSRDTAGKESLFEMEVRFASHILRTVKENRRHSLVLIDELFHSTNPPDAETSARVFLSQLWTVPYVKSIISTHIFGLCEAAAATKERIQPLCCAATEDPATGKITYSYCLSDGICRVSSVREVLQESGLTSVRLNSNQKTA